jgi:MFS family permease
MCANKGLQLHITVNTLAQATAWLILTIGLGLFIANPLAKIYGKRPVYIVAIAIMFATSVWGAATKEYRSFLASRIIAGIGMAPYEVLVQCTIGDLYFVHERATRIAVWNLFLLTGISGGALVAGYIIQDDGYRWTFGVCAIFFGILMVGVVFLVPETSYRRGEYFCFFLCGGLFALFRWFLGWLRDVLLTKMVFISHQLLSHYIQRIS